MQFNADGSLNVPKQTKRDHCTLFSLISELDFPLGKRLLVQVCRGEMNERIRKLNLDKKIYFGTLGGYQEEELETFIEVMEQEGYLQVTLQKNKYPVLMLTKKAEEELLEPVHSYRVDEVQKTTQAPEKHTYTVTPPNTLELKALQQHADFLKGFTEEQQLAIVSMRPRQLCIAGAGSGKTRVLTNKIVYLIQTQGVNPLSILAITFTRKAKKEMQERLAELGVKVRIETFNSFAEKELLTKGSIYYGREKVMASNKEFISLVLQGISNLGFSLDTFIEHYFTARERRGKENKDLFFSFLYDFRAILDVYTQHGKESFAGALASAKISEKVTAENIVKLAEIVHQLLDRNNLRTFSDQLVDVCDMYKNYAHLRRHYDWVLIDEYQDVNDKQTELVEYLNPQHIFAVGDPRQSIYAWRGSNPEQIYSFITEDTGVFELTKNFRSTAHVVNIANASIAQSYKGNNSFAPLQAVQEREGLVSVMRFASEDTESIAVVSQIKELAVQRNEIFVLSRTNKGLDKIASQLSREGIPYIIRTEERPGKQISLGEDKVVLSTVHAAKGLEAEIVFLVAVNMNNYPCKAKDHRFVSLLADKGNYDTYEEERRIFYVACTRAKKELRISHYGAPSPFLNPSVMKHCTHTVAEKQTKVFAKTGANDDVLEQQRQALRRWRYLEAQERGVPPYMIFSDRALDHLLELQPLTLDELEEVSGFGKTKIREFGQDVLHVMYR